MSVGKDSNQILFFPLSNSCPSGLHLEVVEPRTKHVESRKAGWCASANSVRKLGRTGTDTGRASEKRSVIFARLMS